MKIMVGYDGSNASKEAVKVAKKRAKETDATVYVLTSMVQGSEKEQEDIGKAERELDYVKAIFERDNIPCETHLLIRGLSPGEGLRELRCHAPVTSVVAADRHAAVSGDGSTLASYAAAWDGLPALFAKTPEARARKLTARHFSLAAPDGRCDACHG